MQSHLGLSSWTSTGFGESAFDVASRQKKVSQGDEIFLMEA
jgi:hypothetical protein